MKTPVYFFCILLALLTTACDKESATPDKPTEPSVPTYRFISVDYEIQEIAPLREIVARKEQVNSGGVDIAAEYFYESESGYSSEFTPDEPLVGLFEKCDIPIPEVDAEGNFIEPYFWSAPFAPRDPYTYAKATSRIRGSFQLPPRSRFNLIVTQECYRIKAAFECRMSCSDSGPVTIKGSWIGLWRFGCVSETVVSDLK